MSITAQGQSLVPVIRDIDFDPAQGKRVRDSYRGLPASCDSLALTLEALGVRTQVRHNGGASEIVAFWAGDPDDIAAGIETPTDNYEVDLEEVQVSLFAHPLIDAEAAGYISRAQYKKDIEDAVKNGEALSLDTSNFPGAHLVYRELTRGIEAYVKKQPLLKRNRTYSTAYAQKVKIEGTEKVYTTTALIRDFGLPTGLQAQLPDNPSETPQGTVWAWRLRQDNTRYVPALSKIEEVKDWVFAAWPTWLYTVVT